jgi:hypothetical protein
MEPQLRSEREICRVIVFGRDGSEVLLTNSDGGLAFPTVEIPRWERVAENLTSVVKEDLGCDAFCLFTLNTPADDCTSNADRHEVMECWRDGENTNGQVWRAVRSLSPESFIDPGEFKTIERSVLAMARHECDPLSRFARRGCLRELQNWITQLIRPLGLELTDSFRQYNASPSFSLMRFETTGSAVWFKAVGEPNLREFPITLKLAELFPSFMPEIFGINSEWNGWLAREVKGQSLRETKDVALWERAAIDLARLQIESISQAESVLRVGAHDLRFDTLLSAVSPFFEVIGRLMGEQPKTPPAALTRDELRLLRVVVDDAVTLLADLRIPCTLGHLDLNPGNLVVRPDGSVFLDWADAYVGHPFFSLEYLLQHFRRNREDSAKFESCVLNAYTSRWGGLLSDDCVRQALALGPLAAVFAYAVSSAWNEERLWDAKIAGYFRSLARRMNREALRLERRSLRLG